MLRASMVQWHTYLRCLVACLLDIFGSSKVLLQAEYIIYIVLAYINSSKICMFRPRR